MTHGKVDNDSHSDYQQAKTDAERGMVRGVWTSRFQPRFVAFTERQLRCDLPREAIGALSEGKHYASYRGMSMAKDPLDRVLYETLFFELQPRTIIELGAYTGASALWMSDVARTFGIDTHVYSVDIDLSLVDQAARQNPSITFLQGDCNRIEQIFPAAMLADLPHPLVLIDDAHVNIDGVYEHFHRHGLQPGDYMIVEDTIPWIPGTFGQQASDQEWGEWKWEEISRFFSRHADRYRVDRYYTDLFGYNGTWNWNGFLKRV